MTHQVNLRFPLEIIELIKAACEEEGIEKAKPGMRGGVSEWFRRRAYEALGVELSDELTSLSRDGRGKFRRGAAVKWVWGECDGGETVWGGLHERGKCPRCGKWVKVKFKGDTAYVPYHRFRVEDIG